jgi:NAD(P) transhydrogenase subunit alpha
MKIAVPAEKNDPRVAASPESVAKFIDLGFEVAVLKGAGKAAGVSDAAFREAGASIAASAKSLLKDADIVLKLNRPLPDEIAAMKKGALVMAVMNPFDERKAIEAMAKAGVTAFAMELMPRITRAQSMDVLSSQSNLAGYRSVIDAASEFASAFPMMMTAAGTVAPARVFVMGAGVAGLQAIATAKRLGAIVSATDVRRAAEEQVASLGGKFIMVETDEEGETAGGYAREMSEDFKKRQAELVAGHIARQDVVITTALIPGRPAPRLITKAMVESMNPGSVIVDLAAERGGNCELSRPGKVSSHKGVTIVAHTNVAGRVAKDASQLFARNLYNFIASQFDKDKGELVLDWEDEVITGTALTKDGEIILPALKDSEGSA